MIHQRAALPSLLLLATRAFVVAAATAPAGATLQDDAHRPPHVVLVMADDMGYSDIGCYGSEIETPTLDRLATGGLRFTQFYNTSRCCPTRASLLTGLYAHQAGIGQMTSDGGQPGYRGDLSRNAVTLAEVLKSAGYRTYMSGKWHVTKQLKPDGDKSNWPRQRGFDRFYGTIIGAGSFCLLFGLASLYWIVTRRARRRRNKASWIASRRVTPLDAPGGFKKVPKSSWHTGYAESARGPSDGGHTI